MEVNFWKSRKVFVTGHTGFKGSWLSLWLASMGAEVCGYALSPSTRPNIFQAIGIEHDIKSVLADIRDATALEAAMRDFGPEVVIHMAAQPLVRYSYQNPVETYGVNVMGTVHLLDAVRRTPRVRAVVCVTSDKCYENREWVWPYREDEAMGGHDPYSNSKGCAELVISAYRSSFLPAEQYTKHQVAIGSGRAGNVIGGGDWAPDRLVPDIVRAFHAGESVSVRNLLAIRPWQHVLEPLSGYLTLAEHLYTQGAAFASGWNFGPSDSDVQTVRYLVSEMSKLWGDGASWQVVEQEKMHEAHLLRLDSSKARFGLGWKPRWTLVEALKQTVQWYREFYEGRDARSTTLRQIQAFTLPAES